VDWNATARHRVSGRVSFANSIGGFRERLPSGNADSGNRLLSGIVSLDSVLSTRAFNQFRATYTSSFSEVRPCYPSLGDPAVNGQVGVLIVTGLPTLGQFRPPSETRLDQRNVADDVSLTIGAHTLKAGFVLRRLAPSTTSDRGFNGTLVFTSVASFLAGQPVSYSRSLGNSRLDLLGHEFNAYVQDDWRVLPNLMLNLGVR
jgi:outer membrane receptor protein involved in Fe transport